MQVKKQQLEPDMKQGTHSKLGKEYVKAVYCHSAYLTSMQSTSCEILGWIKHKLESRLLGETSVASDMQIIPPYGRKQRGTKESLDESEKGEWKAGLKLIIQKTMIMGSNPIMANKWGKSGNSDRFGVPKLLWIVTAAMKLKDVCSLEEKIW